MNRIFVSTVFCAAVLFPGARLSFAATTPSAATADNDEEDDAQKSKQLEDPSGKLYQKFEMERGFFIGSDLGVFMTFGGAAKAVSNAQPYVGINIGYDFNSWFSWQLHAGRGFAADAARTANESNGPNGPRITDFAFTNFTTGPIVWIRVWERLAIELKVQGGVAILDPIPVDPTIDGISVSGVEPVLGGGVALKYLTLLTDFTLGLDVTFNYIIGINLPSLNIAPTVRYTF
jgi:hypothetical protein